LRAVTTISSSVSPLGVALEAAAGEASFVPAASDAVAVKAIAAAADQLIATRTLRPRLVRNRVD
jgi:hypothetical protein